MKVKDAFKKIMENDESREKFQKDPIGTLKEHGVDTDNLPPEVLDKIAGGSGKNTAANVTAGVTTAAVSIASI